MRLPAIMMVTTLSILARPIREIDINTTPIEKIIDLTLNEGMSKKTVKNVPSILPPVDIEYKLPEMPPTLTIFFVANLIA